MHTSILSALLVLPLALAALNFRLRPGAVRRSEREPREWRQQEPAGDRFVRLDMRRKAPTHNLVPENNIKAARRAVETGGPFSSRMLSSAIPSTISSDPIPSGIVPSTLSFETSSAMFPTDPMEPTAARVNATAMLTDVAYGVTSESNRPLFL